MSFEVLGKPTKSVVCLSRLMDAVWASAIDNTQPNLRAKVHLAGSSASGVSDGRFGQRENAHATRTDAFSWLMQCKRSSPRGLLNAGRT